MSRIKSEEDIELLKEGGKRLARIVREVAGRVLPGITTLELDRYAEKLIREGGDEPAFKNYKPRGAQYPYPAALCVSVNSEVVHGIPNENKVLKDGDIVSLDCGLNHGGLFTDHAITVGVGEISDDNKKLITTATEALEKGVAAARVGNTTGDIGHAIESFIDGRYGIVRVLAGHGVGHAVHEEPEIPNFGKSGEGVKLEPGMVIAIEPMIMIGGDDVVFDDDGYTVRTKDESYSAHMEHTILVTEKGPVILTK